MTIETTSPNISQPSPIRGGLGRDPSTERCRSTGRGSRFPKSSGRRGRTRPALCDTHRCGSPRAKPVSSPVSLDLSNRWPNSGQGRALIGSGEPAGVALDGRLPRTKPVSYTASSRSSSSFTNPVRGSPPGSDKGSPSVLEAGPGPIQSGPPPSTEVRAPRMLPARHNGASILTVVASAVRHSFQSDELPSAALSVTAARGWFLPDSLAAFNSTIFATVTILKTSATRNSEANEELVAWVTANHTIWSHAL